VKSARRPTTYDDLRKVPEHMVAEIIDRELITSPRPAFPHARAASVLGTDLMGTFNGPLGGTDAPGGWWFLFEPELYFGADVVVPDVAGWQRARVSAVPNVPALDQAPDRVCEVISPSTARTDRAGKMRVCGREGVSDFWLLYPSRGPSRPIASRANGGSSSRPTPATKPFMPSPSTLSRS
jgi:Uma2 family endonuclease